MPLPAHPTYLYITHPHDLSPRHYRTRYNLNGKESYELALGFQMSIVVHFNSTVCSLEFYNLVAGCSLFIFELDECAAN